MKCTIDLLYVFFITKKQNKAILVNVRAIIHINDHN